MSRTHYETLEVSEAATQDEIKRSYRRLAKKYHPDRNKRKGAEEKFKEINLAYQVLGDPSRRQIYDYDLGQSRKAGATSGFSSTGASAPPPPPPSGFSSSAGAQAAAPPPSAQGAYRYLFFLRGVLVGGAAAGAIVVLALVSYVACHRASTEQAQSISPPGRAEAVEREKEPTAVPVTPEQTPTIPVPTPTREPEPPTPTPTPVASEPTPSAPEPTQSLRPVHLSGKWRGSFDWFGTRVPFVMRLEQRGDEISGFSTETHDRRIWRATIRGSVTELTVALNKRCERKEFSMTLVASDVSSERIRGTWETPQNRGLWQAVWESESASSVNEPWRLRSTPVHRATVGSGCIDGWWELPGGRRVRCIDHSRRSSP